MTSEDRIMQQSHKVACVVQNLRPFQSPEDIISGVTQLRRQPGQGRVLVAVLRAYLDESSTHEGATLACSAGYVFSHEGSQRFYEEWSAFLAGKGLSGFHATEHCRRRDAAEIFNKLRETTVANAEKGFIRFILSDALSTLKSERELNRFTGSGYTLLTISCMQQIAEYVRSRGDQVWYFIESGEGNEAEFKHFIRQIEDSDELKDKFAYYGASLIPKKDGIQLQCADLSAWSLARVEKEMWIPGFDTWRDWKKFYLGDHQISGFTHLSLQLHAFKNKFDGFQEVPVIVAPKR
jgi:hypothetical protein